tara:strand:- start:693 stop:986 length:294 start_codon:yes stop_codon:yes gene_type:complete
MTKWERAELIALAQKEVLEVNFVKKNGDTRIMTCTLREDMIPPLKTTKTELNEEVKELPKSMPIWDINAKGWRSFIIDNIQSVSLVTSYDTVPQGTN